MAWQDYKNLKIWQKAMDLTDDVYKLIVFLPNEEKYALASQIRRSVTSIPSNIAEGNARLSKKEFKHFLAISKGSIYELETQLLICRRQKYFSDEQTETVLKTCNELSRMITNLILTIE